ncbi:MAG: hypothetical protein GYB41_14650 [Oceanospirillales bacterium]|nr:hypothetical protein [Oceanospirillales bacterium]
MQEPTWPVNKDWQRGQSRPEQVNARFYTAAGITLGYLVTMMALTVQQWSVLEPAIKRFITAGFADFNPLLMLPVMLLTGLLGVPRVLREYVRWRQQRALVMTLDPVPAALDGELGGSLTIPLDLPSDVDVKITINCMRRVVTTGKNASVNDQLLWQSPAVFRRMRSIKGTRIEFCAPLSEQQPPSSFDQGRRQCWWAVHVEVPYSGFDATFPVPVSAEARKKTSDFRFTERERQQSIEAAQESPRSWQQAVVDTSTLSIDFPAGRSGKTAWILMIIGLVFTGVAAFMAYNVWDELNSQRPSYFALMVRGMILLGFGLFSPALLLSGFYMRCNSLRLEAGSQELVTTRHFLFLSKQRRIAVDDVEGLAERVVGRTGQGVDSELDYAIDAYMHDGQRVRLGDGIQGQQEVESLMATLRSITGISYRPDPAAYTLQRRIPPAWVLWLPVLFKSAGILIFGLTIAAFMADFW